MFRFLLLIIIIDCSTIIWGRERVVVTLEDALAIHLYNTSNVQLYHKTLENSRLEYEIFMKSLLPSIKINLTPLSFNHSMKMLQNAVSGEYSNVDESSNVVNFGFTVMQTIGATGGVLSLGSSFSYLLELTSGVNNFSTQPIYINYTQSLFGGRKSFRFEKNINKKAYDLALKNYCSSITDEEMTILDLYLDAYSAKLDIEYYEKQCVIDDTLLAYAKLRHKTGKMTEYECNQIELQQISNAMNLIKAKDTYSHNIRLLEAELHLNDIDVCAPCERRLPKSIDTNEVFYLLKKNNPEYLQNELQQLKSEYDLHITKTNNRFNANISLTYGLNQYSRTLCRAYAHPNQQQAVSVTFAIPVFEWGANKDRILLAQNNYDMALIQHEVAIEKLNEQTIETANSYNRCVRIVDIAKKRFLLSKQQYEFAVMRFSVGNISAIELIDIDNEQLRAKQEFVAVQRELYTTYYKIRHLAMFDFVEKKDIIDLIQME